MIPDQKPVWDRKHGSGEHEDLRHATSTLAILVEPRIPRSSKILDLGCGVGRDARFFAEKGHEVVATDFSEIAIEINKKKFSAPGIQFLVLDMIDPFPFKDETFDVVHANLSIQYFPDKRTKMIIEEIHRILKPKGIFDFSCKSISDFHSGNGEEVEKNVFVSEKGHVRHLFSISYAGELMKDKFKVIILKEVEEVYSEHKSNMIQCIARKI